MVIDGLTLAYAVGAGAASFFSPCSVGLLPAYVGYFISTRALNPEQQPRLWVSLSTGLSLGLSASMGFFALLLAAAVLILLIPFQRVTPVLPYVSLLMGASIILLGALLLVNRAPTLPFRISLAERSTGSIFLFGLTYALVSLGCTFPLFLSVVLGAASLGGSVSAAIALVAYATGMAVVMVAITLALAVSREGVARFLRTAVPWVTRIAALVMVVAGGYVMYYWGNVLRA